MHFHKSAHLFASVSLLALAACSGGGGGSNTGGSIVNGPVVTPPTPTANITGVTALGYAGATPNEATGATPNFATPSTCRPTARSSRWIKAPHLSPAIP